MKKLLLTTSILFLAAACNKQVAVQPVVQNQLVQTTQPVQQEPQATSTSVDDNWKTYTNSQLSFSIEYPASWVYDDTAGHIENSDSHDVADIDFRTENQGRWIVEVRVAKTTENLQDVVANNHPNLAIDTGISATATSKAITLNGQSAIQFYYQAPKGYSYYGDTQTFIIHNNYLYTISEASGSDTNESTMLQSFKFTN